ncbi:MULTISPECIES: dihydroorotate dehydrogenase-like protein [Okeania]|uniref:Dihydroorotate dehydrogenase-like protein n=1 Tax=Okeania hirsuta TaxID=1458930 RepID=A0A3N6R5P3_9CYAN|nr:MULTISPECIES: dihydroorotate dehydrogenase-like protein [Okeania]NES77133.1 dihydroorotate dehydrogenase-like protein [Okeania sp. SIO1H4]NES89869.1 dihydroorotate dehydrogenase-like protein [Okeania sp. SIO2B9]NET20777.1 dihydroorotate dehydrogenase-like protein [Okeania sp. SIO1H5]NET79358.1 dihydroorotate dehydrogenase-like protein [Okeania sp. SIO1F9]NET97332.1 dihydroorotate dehydrogenase-like protein [Okeania sp. SIO1H2]
MDITTNYLGLQLRSPLVVGAAAPLTEDLDNLKRMEDAGAAAVVLHSLFEEQLREERLELQHHLEYGTESFPEALTYFPEPEVFHVGVSEYLKHISQAKKMVNMPIIASLNGSTIGGWTHYAKELEAAGADALELNIYNIPTNMDMTGEQVEQNYISILQAVKSEVNIPVSIKLSPFFSNMANMSKKLVEAGVNGLVLFNRFYQPDINIEELEVVTNVLLSTPQAMRLPMRWIAILYGRLEVDFAATSGVQKGQDVIKMVMAGANVTQLVGTLLRHGINHIQVIENEMIHWMEEHEYESIAQMRGSMSQINCPDESKFERAQYMKAIQSYKPAQSLV